MIIGFSLIFLAASGGAFIAVNATQRALEGNLIEGWSELLQTSSHGHTSLFGMIHILFGLTLPYSKITPKVKLLQTIGIGCGSLAMGPLMLFRSSFGPTSSFEINGVIIGSMLSLALAAIGVHIFGLMLELQRRV